jgi:hypothetical protein
MKYKFEVVTQKRLAARALDSKERIELTQTNSLALLDLRGQLRQQGQPFFYRDRIRRLVEQILIPEIQDAFDRCNVAMDGLAIVYGWKATDDPLPPLPPTGDGYYTGDFVELLHAWVNRQIRKLLKFSHCDQIFSVTHSIGPIPGEVEVSFDLPEIDALKVHSYVRSRGISVFVEADEPSAIFNVSLKVPPSAYYRYNAENNSDPVDQSKLPTCFLGRAGSRLIDRSPEVGGLTSLINSSPLAIDGSKWTIKVTPANTSASTTKIKDVQMELNLVGHWA